MKIQVISLCTIICIELAFQYFSKSEDNGTNKDFAPYDEYISLVEYP